MSYTPDRKYVHQLSDIPEEPHWAILKIQSTYIPGDERSRTSPGHGYPAHTTNSVEYIVFKDEAVWKAEITRLMSGGKKDFRAIRVEVAHISTEVKVNIS